MRVDVAVLGGGPAGCATAIGLAWAGARVIIIDRATSGNWKIGEVLPASATTLLRDLGVWGNFRADGHLPSRGNRSVWGSPEEDTCDFAGDANGVGWHLDRERFDARLVEASASAGAAIHRVDRLERCDWSQRRGWLLCVRSGTAETEVQADVVVDASGRVGWLARTLNAPREADDRLVGVVASFAPAAASADRDTFTQIEAARDGWWYAALVPGQQLVVAYMSDADLVTAQRAGTIVSWRALLDQTHHIRDRIESHRYRLIRGPRIVSASSTRLVRAQGRAWLAVGDAAATFDPLSSHGITHALETAVLAARSLATGHQSALDSYAAWVEAGYVDYLTYRHAYYSMEGRWPASTFWRRRHVRTPFHRAAE